MIRNRGVKFKICGFWTFGVFKIKGQKIGRKLLFGISANSLGLQPMPTSINRRQLWQPESYSSDSFLGESGLPRRLVLSPFIGYVMVEQNSMKPPIAGATKQVEINKWQGLAKSYASSDFPRDFRVFFRFLPPSVTDTKHKSMILHPPMIPKERK